jgi:hypothetical protein
VAECRAAVVWAECTKSPHRAIHPSARHCRAEESKSKKGVSVQPPRRPFFFYPFRSARAAPEETASLPSAVRVNGMTRLAEGEKPREAASPVEVTI